jgi:tetratricopeptide (TPR) repeat protein
VEEEVRMQSVVCHYRRRLPSLDVSGLVFGRLRRRMPNWTRVERETLVSIRRDLVIRMGIRELEVALRDAQQDEALCLRLGNKDGLQANYGNQALILSAWGRLEEAMALLKKKEALCLELGNKNGLQASYGNQALIMRASGRLQEALALLRKKEAICLELVNLASMAYCYWNWGLLAREQRNRKAEREKLAAALDIFTKLNMSRERDAVRAELEKTIAAGATTEKESIPTNTRDTSMSADQP